MTPEERATWDQMVAQAASQRSYLVNRVDFHRARLNDAVIQDNPGRIHQRTNALRNVQRELAQVDAILAANRQIEAQMTG